MFRATSGQICVQVNADDRGAFVKNQTKTVLLRCVVNHYELFSEPVYRIHVVFHNCLSERDEWFPKQIPPNSNISTLFTPVISIDLQSTTRNCFGRSIGMAFAEEDHLIRVRHILHSSDKFNGAYQTM